MSDAAGKKGFPLEVYISSPALLDLLSAFNYIQTDSKSQDAPPVFQMDFQKMFYIKKSRPKNICSSAGFT